jgi:hypothetical protein
MKIYAKINQKLTSIAVLIIVDLITLLLKRVKIENIPISEATKKLTCDVLLSEYKSKNPIITEIDSFTSCSTYFANFQSRTYLYLHTTFSFFFLFKIMNVLNIM